MTDDNQDTTGEGSERDTDQDTGRDDAAEGTQISDGVPFEQDDEAEKSGIAETDKEVEVDEEAIDEKEEKGDAESSDKSSGGSRFGRDVDRYVLWGGLLLSGLLGTVAAFNLYFQVGSIIDVWIAGRYQPIFQAGFNLVVLLVAGYVTVTIADRLDVGR